MPADARDAYRAAQVTVREAGSCSFECDPPAEHPGCRGTERQECQRGTRVDLTQLFLANFHLAPFMFSFSNGKGPYSTDMAKAFAANLTFYFAGSLASSAMHHCREP
jgi:hypothetical protein